MEESSGFKVDKWKRVYQCTVKWLLVKIPNSVDYIRFHGSLSKNTCCYPIRRSPRPVTLAQFEKNHNSMSIISQRLLF